MLIAQSELIHKDPKYWTHPSKLYPEHFLDEQGNLDSKKTGFLPFSIGKTRWDHK